MNRFIWTFQIAALAVLAASFGGALHSLGDALAVFRLQLGAVGLILALILILRRSRWASAAALVCLAALIGPTLQSYAPQSEPQGPVTLYQKNLSYRAHDLGPLQDDILAADTDVLTLQEVAPDNIALLTALAPALPVQLVCPFARVGAVAIATRWPLVPGSEICLEGQGMAALQAQGPDGPVWLVSLHLHWPWPHRQSAQRDRLVPYLQGLGGPVLIGGDFNMVPWSHTVTRIEDATGTAKIGRAFNSFPRFSPLAPLAIDHVLAPSGATGLTERRPLLGSDHHGILARLELPQP